MKIISLGAGVQSTILALLSDREELVPKVDACIFADTQCEPKAIYHHLDWLEEEISISIHRVTAGDLKNDVINGKNSSGGDFITIPLFTKEGNQIKLGRRQCTREYKITPIQRECRRLAGYERFQRIPAGEIELMIGITTDEVSRMKDSRVKYIKHIFPFIELGWSRQDCKEWFAKSYPNKKLEKSSCIFCPYRTNDAWIKLKKHSPDEWKEVVAIDKRVRHLKKDKENYIHPSALPIDEAIHKKESRLNLLEMECEGMCGV